MQNKRIVARLDIKGSDLVKGIHLEGLRVLGDPNFFAQEYYKDGADELFYQDVVASLYKRNSLFEIINKTSKNIFIPLTVSGGLRTIDDMKKAFNAGADKVCINTAAVKNPNLINKAANIFGSSNVVVGIETSLNNVNSTHYVYTNNGREITNKKTLDWSIEVSKRGAGELAIISIDKDGTKSGYDLELINKIKKNVSIPVIAHGGAGNINHIYELFKYSGCDASSCSSILHYSKFNKQDNFKQLIGNQEFLLNNEKIEDKISIKKIKNYLVKKKIKIIKN
jgi:cyclase